MTSKITNHILLIEDDTDIRDLLQESLELEGYHVTCKRDGLEGLDFLKTDPAPHLIVLDLMMPRMNGWEFLKAKNTHSEWQKIPVVLLTAVGDSYFDLTLADTVIKKPLELDQFLDAIQKHLKNVNSRGD